MRCYVLFAEYDGPLGTTQHLRGVFEHKDLAEKRIMEQKDRPYTFVIEGWEGDWRFALRRYAPKEVVTTTIVYEQEGNAEFSGPDDLKEVNEV